MSKDGMVKATAVYTRALTERARQIHHTSPVATAALGRALAGVSMMGNALKGSGVKVLVDGGIRSGVDVFKALALGADGVLICRPFVTAVYGGGEEGVKCYIDKIAGELADTMQMCGAHSISEITPDMVRV